MPPPTEAREGYSGLVGDACARQLDMHNRTWWSRRPTTTLPMHLTLDSDANVCAGAKQKVSAVSLGVMDTGS